MQKKASAAAASESQAKAANQNAAAQSSAAAASAQAASKQAAQSQSEAAAAKASSQQSAQPAQAGNVINNSAQAIAAAEARYGNNGGDWVWSCLFSENGNYFVKALSKSSNTMTKTAMSVMVHADGSMEQQ